jgi:hypothetical protein
MPPDERRDDHAPPQAYPIPGGQVGLAALAADYLRAVLRADPDAIDFHAAADDAAAPRVSAATERARRREWRRQWRRLRLADQVAAYADALARATDADAVHAALAWHAAEIVGAYTCIVFVPDARGVLASLPAHPRPLGEGVLHLTERPAAPCLLTRDDRARFGGLARLFDEERAASVACQPVADEMVLALLERRADRTFDEEDWGLLRLVAAQAESALQRVGTVAQLLPRRSAGSATQPAGDPHLDALLAHVDALAEWDEELAVAALEPEVEGDAQDRRRLADELRRVCGDDGVVVRRSGGAFLVLLPGVSGESARARFRDFEGRLPPGTSHRYAIAARGSNGATVRELVEAAEQALPVAAVAP